MAEVTVPGLSTEQVLALIAANAPATQFVANGAPMTIADLMANYPPSASVAGLYARVTNLYNNVSTSAAGGLDEILRCRFDATNNSYRWMPQRPDYNTVAAATGGTVTLTPLVTPPTVRLTGTLLGNLSITASTVNAYIGQRFNVIQNSTLGLFATTITGLIGSNITLLGNTVQLIEYTSGGWAKAST
jgi:hypothetical protein